jgi:hypothetical protein
MLPSGYNSRITAHPSTPSHCCIIVWRSRRTADDGKQALPQENGGPSQRRFCACRISSRYGRYWFASTSLAVAWAIRRSASSRNRKPSLTAFSAAAFTAAT